MMQNSFIRKRTTIKEIFNNDPELEEKYQKIVELLITAGYFRARLQNLEPFDKILGGIAWTLTGCFYDIDIDFKDEMNLTEKIRVSEKITAGLKSINCPFILNPIQLQGLDLNPIYQTLQWLVKKLIDTRDERNELNKKFSINYLTSKMENEQIILGKNDELIQAKYKYFKSNRMFRPKAALQFDYNDELRIFFAMIEYGLNKDISFQRQLLELLRRKNMISKDKGDSSDPSKNKSSMGKGGMDGNPDQLSSEEIKKLDEIINTNIEEIKGKDKQKVNTSIIESIFSENMNTIINEIEHFENTKGDENIDKIKLFVKEKERLESNKQNLLGQITEYESELNQMENVTNEENDEMDKLKSEIFKLQQTLKENQMNKEKITEKVKEEKLSEEKLKFLSEKNKEKEELKNAISKFKKNCLEEKKNYDAQLDNYNKKIERMNDQENLQVFDEIDRNYNEELQKTLEKKKDLFEQNKIINLLTRTIQVCPSKLEVIQYQKRFQELYDQINLANEKSQRIVGEFNSKSNIINLLNQRHDVFFDLKNLHKTLKNKREKEDFKVTLNNVHNTLNDSLQQTSERLKETNKEIEINQKKLNELQAFEANYMKLIKEYNKEYNCFNAMNQ